MARLNGGKVLLDLRNREWNGDVVSTDKELIKSILSKGLECLINIDGVDILCNAYFSTTATQSSTELIYTLLADADGEYSVNIDLENFKITSELL